MLALMLEKSSKAPSGSWFTLFDGAVDLLFCGLEGVSYTDVNRGDRTAIEPLLAGIVDWDQLARKLP